MAEKDQKEEKELEVDGGGKKKNADHHYCRCCCAIALGGAGAFFFLGGSDDVSEEELAAELDSGEVSESGQMEEEAGRCCWKRVRACMYLCQGHFVLTFRVHARDRFVEIRVQLLVRGGDNEEEAKKHVPLIESTCLNVFAQANADDLGYQCR